MKLTPAKKKRSYKIGRSYSCWPSTHSKIESIRKARGLKSGGGVIDAIIEKEPTP